MSQVTLEQLLKIEEALYRGQLEWEEADDDELLWIDRGLIEQAKVALHEIGSDFPKCKCCDRFAENDWGLCFLCADDFKWSGRQLEDYVAANKE